MVSKVSQAQPEMLVLAREFRGMTQADVAAAMTATSAGAGTTVSQGYVSKAESGRLAVTGERLELYAAALSYPPDLLCLDPQVHGVGIGLIHHRKRASLPVGVLRRIHAQLALTRIQLNGLYRAASEDSVRGDFPRVELSDLVTPKDAARTVRKQWGMPAGPVPDVVRCVEAGGALVVLRELESDLLDAVSQWTSGQAPLLLVNGRAPGDRCRFSVAHELGHLVMHREPGSGPEQEKQADAFASEFLMPASDIRGELAGGVDIARLAGLKRRWRVSMSALLRRALALNAITDWQYRTVIIEMSALGYRTAEPVHVPLEEPCRVPLLVDRLLEERNLTTEQVASSAHLLPGDFLRLYREGNRLLSVNSPRR
ncbi:helix-turn-helix domain-containing protein [[Kitasatospora] papulosa]|uniref:helix-turn-helix domain-containing protein n=1 Tax=[Kitasatospora] papulosa TaxID=1464011 RepID=UPI0036AD42B0